MPTNARADFDSGTGVGRAREGHRAPAMTLGYEAGATHRTSFQDPGGGRAGFHNPGVHGTPDQAVSSTAMATPVTTTVASHTEWMVRVGSCGRSPLLIAASAAW